MSKRSPNSLGYSSALLSRSQPGARRRYLRNADRTAAKPKTSGAMNIVEWKGNRTYG
jgi:hypothetical protein